MAPSRRTSRRATAFSSALAAKAAAATTIAAASTTAAPLLCLLDEGRSRGQHFDAFNEAVLIRIRPLQPATTAFVNLPNLRDRQFAVFVFIVLGIVINAGGSPSKKVYGTTYWRDPGIYPITVTTFDVGAFNNGFNGICSVFVTAAFSFGGSELAGLAAAETVNP